MCGFTAGDNKSMGAEGETIRWRSIHPPGSGIAVRIEEVVEEYRIVLSPGTVISCSSALNRSFRPAQDIHQYSARRDNTHSLHGLKEPRRWDTHHRIFCSLYRQLFSLRKSDSSRRQETSALHKGRQTGRMAGKTLQTAPREQGTGRLGYSILQRGIHHVLLASG